MYKSIVSKKSNETSLLMQRSNVFSNKRKAKTWATRNCTIMRTKGQYEEVNWLVLDTATNHIVYGGSLRKGGYTWRKFSKNEIELINMSRNL